MQSPFRHVAENQRIIANIRGYELKWRRLLAAMQLIYLQMNQIELLCKIKALFSNYLIKK